MILQLHIWVNNVLSHVDAYDLEQLRSKILIFSTRNLCPNMCMWLCVTFYLDV